MASTGPVTAWLFLRAIGLIYLIAFVSLLVQVDGLIGPRGVLPAADFLGAVFQAVGSRGYWLVPTVFWTGASTAALQGVCVAGALAATAVVVDFLEMPALMICWGLYLSLMGVGQEFLSFQWDSLLVEAGALALLTPLWPEALTWMFRWLLFRLMFLSGAVKLLSGDSTWRDLTALSYHFQTQPLPNPISWYVHQLPARVLQGMTLGTLVAEAAIPFAYFAPRRARRVAAVCTVVFQGLILLTGNYTFFNLLTMALALWLLDDGVVSRWMPSRLLTRATRRGPVPTVAALRWPLTGALSLIALLSAATVWRSIGGTVPQGIELLEAGLEPLRLTSSYGLFAVMTTTRPEIVFEGSEDAVTWVAYEFRYKPGDERRPPPWVAPYHPRLDWQMWFAALGDAVSDRWVIAFARRLLEGSPPVMRLLSPGPWRDHPPRYVRATLYDYRFTDWAGARASGAWWTRRPTGPYLPALTLAGGRLQRAD